MDFSKLKRAPRSPEPDDGQPVEAIIKVNQADYVPPQVKVRARIDDLMFTTRTTHGTVKLLRSDPKVVSVQESEPLRFPE
jgi:hypothetical protein